MRANMKAERARLNLSASSAAKQIGISVNTLLTWERGDAEPLSVKLLKMAQLYDCTPEYLLGMTDERKKTLIAQ